MKPSSRFKVAQHRWPLHSLVSVALLVPALASAEFKTGQQIQSGLQDWYSKPSNDIVNAAVSFGYVLGVYDALTGVTMFCPPNNVSQGQVVQVVLKFLNQNPEKLHFSADSLVVKALQQAWPCAKTK